MICFHYSIYMFFIIINDDDDNALPIGSKIFILWVQILVPKYLLAEENIYSKIFIYPQY